MSTKLTFANGQREYKAMAIISVSELGRRAGISRQGASKWIKEWKIPILIDEHSKKGVDENNADVAAYILHDNSRRSSGRVRTESEANSESKIESKAMVEPVSLLSTMSTLSTEQSPGEKEHNKIPLIEVGGDRLRRRKKTTENPSRSDYQARKEKGMAERYELNNRIIRHQYVPIDETKQVFGRIYSVHTGVIYPLGAKLADQLAAEFGITDPVKILRGQQILEAEHYQAVSQIKREIDDFLAEQESRVVTEAEELAIEADEE